MSEDAHIFFMKHLIPNGDGAFVVFRLGGNTEEGAKALHDMLQLNANFGDATAAEYDAFLSAAPAVGSVLKNEEWARIEGLSDDEKKAVRGAVQGLNKVVAA